MTTTTNLIERLLQRNEDGTLVEITEVDQQQAADLLEAQAKQIEALQAKLSAIESQPVNELVEALEELMRWQVKNVKVWNNSAYDNASRALANAKASQPMKLDDIEQYRMQMAGISTAALGYWKESDTICPDYDTLALRDVAKLYAKYDELYKAAQPLTKEKIEKVLHALESSRVMARDKDGNYFNEVTPPRILEAIEIMKGVR